MHIPSAHFRHRWLGVLAFALALATTCLAADHPVFELDLRSLGAVGLEAPDSQSKRPVYGGQIGFLDDSTLAITFPVFNPALKLSTRDRPAGGSMLLHTAIIDLDTGRTRNEKSWGNVASLQMQVAGSRLVLISDRRLQVMSRDLQPEHEYQYTLHKQFQVRTSETGNTLFLVVPGEQDQLVEVVDTAGKQPSYTFHVPSDGKNAFSDSAFAFARRNGTSTELFSAPLEQLRRGTADLRPLAYRPETDCSEPFFITDEWMVLGGRCDELVVVARDGAIKARAPVVDLPVPAAQGASPRGLAVRYLTRFVASRDQTRFAFLLRDPKAHPRKGELPATAYHATALLVYDTSLTKLFEAPLRKVEKATYALDQALSPNGSLVAVLVGWTVTVYRVPEPPSPAR